MAFTIQTEIKIHADAEKVWNVLTDFPRIHTWNPFIKSITGQVAEGKRIKVELGGMRFDPKVLAFEKSKEFRWLGNLWFPGLFDGEHQFLLEPQPDGSTLLHHRENFKGILVPLFRKKLNTETVSHFESFNAGLKYEVENR